MLRRSFIQLAACLLLSGCALQPAVETPVPAEAAVAVPDRFSADVAEAVLRDGGNAVDAAIAVAFTLAVTYPEAGNIGGGGFMLIAGRDGPAFLDYRETAPGAATADMYLDADGDVVPESSLVGHRAAGVPGTVAGLWEAHRRYGSLPWTRLVEPAIRLAADGFPAPAQLEARIAEGVDWYAGRTNFARHFGALRGGDVFRQPALAATLQRIADEGSAGFYDGETAALIVAEMARGGGLVSAADLAGYRAVWRDPLAVDWRGYRLLSAPPPSSGGFAVVQLLGMKDALAADFAGLGHNSPQYIHLVAEMEKRVFADRAEYLGDPAFVDVPIAKLIDPAYIAARAAEVNPRGISTIATVRPGLESPHTTHFSIVDRQGMAVSNTYTINAWFGNGVVVEGAGFLLNNEMDDFSIKPGVPNYYGVIGREANAIAPGKRMLSSMSPTVLLEDGEPVLVIGTPGGSTIFTSVFQGIVNILDFGMSAADAAAATRFHHQLLPPELVTFSPGRPLPAATIEALEGRGYRVEPHGWEFGDLQILWRRGGQWTGGSDPRGRGESRVITFPANP